MESGEERELPRILGAPVKIGMVGGWERCGSWEEGAAGEVVNGGLEGGDEQEWDGRVHWRESSMNRGLPLFS